MSNSFRSEPTLQEEDDETLPPNVETLKCELEGLQILRKMPLSSSSEPRPQDEDLHELVGIQLSPSSEQEEELQEVLLKAELLDCKLDDLLSLKEYFKVFDTDSEEESTGQEMLASSDLNLNKLNLKEEAVREMLSSCRSEMRRLEPDNEALLLKAESLKSKLEGLQILNEKLCGECLDALSLMELRSLESQLRQGLDRVRYPLEKKTIELEEEEKRLVKEEDTDTCKQLIKRKRNQGIRSQLVALKGRKLKRQRAREERSSPEGRFKRQDWDDILILLRNMNSMKWEIQKWQLWNERMCGREIAGLDYYELMILRKEIADGFCDVWYWIVRKQQQEKPRLGGPILKARKKMHGEEEHGGQEETLD